MHINTVLATAASFLPFANAITQGNCVDDELGLSWLGADIRPEAVISCFGQPLQQYSAQRYWGEQYAKNASVVVFPTCSDDVSLIMRSIYNTSLSDDFTFVGGAHSMVNASSSYGLVIDLSYLNHTSIVHNYTKHDGSTTTAISYEGGAVWGGVYNVTGGSGHTAVGARDVSVGVGGFSTGGGIGFLAGAYGFATDRLLAADVVLPSGKQVTATDNNEYSDLLWALRGGNGQFGIVTTFYQEAAPEPTSSELGFYYVSPSDLHVVQQNTVDFFANNTDPFSLMYYAPGYFPSTVTSTDPGSFDTRVIVVALHFNDPTNPNQPSYNQTFGPLLQGWNTSNSQVYDIPYASAASLADAFFPFGYRRLFTGPQVPSISVDFLSSITNTFYEYIHKLLASGEKPLSSNFVLQYMYPGLNGHLPVDDSATAWPHHKVGHQMLFSPGWSQVENDRLADEYAKRLHDLGYEVQRGAGVAIADYPNYVGPGETGRDIWGQNLERLFQVKQKYDPLCLLRKGKVFASPGCLEAGVANVFAN